MNQEISIIFEDQQILVINKPAGIIVNRAETTKNEITIQDWAEDRIGIINDTSQDKDRPKYGEEGWDPSLDFYHRGGIVHRIDKETSGILIIAKTPGAFVKLQNQFKERYVKKTYLALAHGIIKPQKGEISVPVGRLPWDKKRFGILPGGKESKTLYTVVSYYQQVKEREKLSLVELYPQSGRTHQIRVHLKYINHPIFSDYLYAGRKTSRNDRNYLSRVFLHAAKIEFTHPGTDETVSFEAAMPLELSDLLNTFEKVSL
ncbi:MAG TPA: RluA family pseudouridine synthase [Candidatus Saccharimonadales bacterium]|nr:RluA family pseudouridine synthase [Candidatus Saccharimonadales bacterium]